MAISVVRGLSFPLRVGNKGGFVMSNHIGHIEESIVQILSTQFYERVMLPEFGSDIDAHIFDPNEVETHALVQYEIVEALTKYEPRIVIDEEGIEIEADGSSMYVTLSYALANYTNMGLVSTKVKIGGDNGEN